MNYKNHEPSFCSFVLNSKKERESSRKMDLNKYPLDLILVPLSVFFTVSYHLYRLKCTKGVKKNGSAKWIESIFQENEKKGTLGVQSLRNSLMATILSATVSMLLNSALAALTNNAYKSNFLNHHKFFGSQGAPTILLKYATISLLLLLSFFCSSMAVGLLIEANFLINAAGESFNGIAEDLMKKGWELASVGNRVLVSTGPVLMWLLGPVPLVLSSVGLIGFFYSVDFGRNGFRDGKAFSK
ncbi:hypothetical protein LUZ60_003916 [Juncus effusus]|nr:hypothetical protein LUZ60_003916 [Juncus effusus]